LTLGTAKRGDDAVERALAALRANRPGEAERIARDMLRDDPRHGRASHILGCALLMLDRPHDALAPLEVAARGSHDPEIETQLAIALRRIGRHDEARSRLKRTVKRHPAYGPAFLEFGSLLSAMERYDEAIEMLRRGLAVAPMTPDLSIQLGYVLLDRRSFAEAKAAFARALAIAPNSWDALFGIAKAHQEVGESQPAADYFRRCLMSAPDDAGTWLNLGHCLLELGQVEAGYDCFRAAARGDPKRYGNALTSLASSGHGRFWLKPSAAARYFRRKES
jgi:tetratricopeptide (TPR) repeat protein